MKIIIIALAFGIVIACIILIESLVIVRDELEIKRAIEKYKKNG